MKLSDNKRLSWIDNEDIRPYIFVREDNRISQPGSTFEEVDWFTKEPLRFDPLKMSEVGFANEILDLEEKTFGGSNLSMPRWVFFDCAIMPGFIAGFAHKISTLPEHLHSILKVEETQKWVPLSLFIAIPTLVKDEWIAHNLCSVNSLIPKKEDRYYGLGFLTKAFSLWFANIESCCGVTQWESPAMKLHSQYGVFEVITAYTPTHNYASTLTYRLSVNPSHWAQFFNRGGSEDFKKKYKFAGFRVDPLSEKSLIEFQKHIEVKDKTYFLDPDEILYQKKGEDLKIYVSVE